MNQINLRDMNREELLALQDAVNREIENRRIEERLRWEIRRRKSGDADAIDGTAG